RKSCVVQASCARRSPERGVRRAASADASARDLPPELAGVSVKELVKAIGESRANGNGVTPPGTPRRASRSSSPRLSRSSSPVAVPGAGGGDFSGPSSQRRGSTQSDTSALVSSLTRDLSQSPSGATTSAATRELSPSASCSSLASPNSAPGTPRRHDQACTQTSPESGALTTTTTTTAAVAAAAAATAPVRGHFSIGASGVRGEESARLSPKPARKERAAGGAGKARSSKRAIIGFISSRQSRPFLLVMTVSVAYWFHIPDVNACSLNAMLGSQGGTRARQRHSVEVSTAGTYLHIQPSTLETLTRSAANANANRNRKKQQQQQQQAAAPGEDAPVNGAAKLQWMGQLLRAPVRLQALPEAAFHTVAVLPPALRALVCLWEELSASCLQAIERQETALPRLRAT
ncbi:Uncharacterized protein GBIM_17651, partial [Gryllus bimaculatus]